MASQNTYEYYRDDLAKLPPLRAVADGAVRCHHA